MFSSLGEAAWGRQGVERGWLQVSQSTALGRRAKEQFSRKSLKARAGLLTCAMELADSLPESGRRDGCVFCMSGMYSFGSVRGDTA